MKVMENGWRPTLVIFDLDGTLYPREAYVEQILNVIAEMFVQLRGLSPEAADAELETLRRAIRDDWDKTSTTSFVVSRGFTMQQWHDFRARYMLVAERLQMNPQVVNDLARLRTRVGIALLTNNTRAATGKILQRIGFGKGAFDAVVTAEDVGGTPKPDKRAFEAVLATMRVQAVEAWAVGDRYHIDVEPLRKMGGAGIVVSGPKELSMAVDHLLKLHSDHHLHMGGGGHRSGRSSDHD